MPTDATRRRPQRGIHSVARAALVFLLAVAGCLSPAVNADLSGGHWYRYRSSHFDVYSRLGESKVADQIRQLEVFRAAIQRFLEIKDSASIESDARLLLLQSGTEVHSLFHTSPDVVGFMRPDLRRNLIVATVSSHLIGVNEVVFHEYVHFLVRSASSFRYPPWFDEGLAQMLAASRIQGDAFLVGAVPKTSAEVIRYARPMALDRLIGTDAIDDLGGRDTARFYATSWLLVHYLLLSDFYHGDQGLRRQTTRYLTAYNAGRGDRHAFETLVRPLPALDADLHGYLRHIPAWKVPLKQIEYDPSYVRTAVSPTEIAAALAEMIVASNPQYARRLLERVLKNDPSNARALAELGVSYQMESDFARAESLMRQALALGDADYVVPTELADLLVARCRAESKSPACADSGVRHEVLTLYQRAQTLNPDSPETLTNYASALARNGHANPALEMLTRAYRLAPSAYPVVLNLGIANAQAGHWDAARTFLKRAEDWAVDVPAERARVGELIRKVELAASSTPHRPWNSDRL